MLAKQLEYLAGADVAQHMEIAEKRKSMVGSGDRSERIRTYNFPQRRVTDHRIGLTVHNLPGIMEGQLDGIIDALVAAGVGREALVLA